MLPVSKLEGPQLRLQDLEDLSVLGITNAHKLQSIRVKW